MTMHNCCVHGTSAEGTNHECCLDHESDLLCLMAEAREIMERISRCDADVNRGCHHGLEARAFLAKTKGPA